NQAAFALKRSRLHEQLEKTHRTTKLVAEVTTLGNLSTTLDLITNGTKDSLDCDAVTLYCYDSETECLLSPPSMAGVNYPDRARKLTLVPPSSPVFSVLISKEIVTVTDVRTNDLFKGSRFSADEGIHSWAGIPLKMDDKPVGAMFVNYRRRHVFSESEIADMELFSSQAAIAIHNARLFDRTEKDLREREKFLELSNQLLGTLDIQETMNCATKFTATALDTEF